MTENREEIITLDYSEPVDPENVDKTLAELWRKGCAGPAPDGEEIRINRACLWNQVVYNPKPEKEFRDVSGHGYGLRKLLGEVTPMVPSRIIRLEYAEGKTLPGNKEAVARVAAQCAPLGGGISQIFVQEINFLVHGPEGDSHFPSLVQALLEPSLPIALLWLDDLPHRGWLLDQLLPLSDRLIFDSYSAHMESDLIVVQKLMEEFDVLFVDIGWMRLAPVRHILAEFFDPPQRIEQLKDIRGITLETTPAGHNAGLLLLGWFLKMCGHTHFEGQAQENKEVLHNWRIGTGKKSFPVEFRLSQGEGGRDGLILVEIQAGGEVFSIRQIDADYVSLNSPGDADRKVALHGWRDSELVVAGLGGAGLDRLYPDVIKTAAELVRAEG